MSDRSAGPSFATSYTMCAPMRIPLGARPRAKAQMYLAKVRLTLAGQLPVKVGDGE